MTTIFCKSDGAALIPQSKAALIALFNLPRETSLKVVVTKPRNIKAHRLFFAFATYVAEALNDGPAPALQPWTPEKVVELMKLATGNVELAALPQQIRGFGHVKEKSALAARHRRARVRPVPARFRRSAPLPGWNGCR